MAALVVYESMFGNTHEVAEAIARGLSEVTVAKAVSLHEATAELLGSADVLVVGGPTHVHGMVRHSTRRSAIEQARTGGPTLDVHAEDDAEGQVLRDWFDGLGRAAGTPAAAFDTRVDINPLLSGRASKAIARQLERHRCNLVSAPESFLVDKENHLVPGELERAEAWGRDLGSRVRTHV